MALSAHDHNNQLEQLTIDGEAAWAEAARSGASPEVALRVAQWLDTLNAADIAHQARRGSVGRYATFALEEGRVGKYLRVTMTVEAGPQSVHAFVEKETGKIAKAGGWKGPQKDRAGQLAYRFDLLDDASRERLMTAAAQPDSFTGGYLYAGR